MPPKRVVRTGAFHPTQLRLWQRVVHRVQVIRDLRADWAAMGMFLNFLRKRNGEDRQRVPRNPVFRQIAEELELVDLPVVPDVPAEHPAM